jgi:hypothetical protein
MIDISSALSAISAATKAISGIIQTVRDVEVMQAVSGVLDSLLDAQSKLLSAQAEYEKLAEVKRQLEQKIMEYEKWDAEVARYKLQEIAGGIFVYALQSDRAAGEPIHWLCPNCFNQRQKSILTKPVVDNTNYKCHRCSFDVIPTPTVYPRNPSLRSNYLGRD